MLNEKHDLYSLIRKRPRVLWRTWAASASRRPESEQRTQGTHNHTVFPINRDYLRIFLLSAERLSRSTSHLIGGGGEGGVCTFLLKSDVQHRPFCADPSDKIPEGGTSTSILHLSACNGSESNVFPLIVVSGPRFWRAKKMFFYKFHKFNAYSFIRNSTKGERSSCILRKPLVSSDPFYW